MRTLVKLIATLFTYLLLSACGGGGGDPLTQQPPANTGPEIAALDLLVNSPQLGSSGALSVTVTAIAKDSNNLLLQDIPVGFTASSGALQVVNAATNFAGQALATLSTGGNTANRTITVTARAGGLTRTITVNVIGTTIDISGENSLTLGNTSSLTLTLTNSDDDPLPGKAITVTSALGNAINTQSLITDNAGQVRVVVVGTVAGQDTITASAEGTTTTFTLSVSGDLFRFIAPPIDSELITDQAHEVVLEWQRNGVPMASSRIDFKATRGRFTATSDINGTPITSVMTDAQGRASLFIASPNPGPADITASVQSGPSATIEVEFVVPVAQASKIDLQTDKSTIGPNNSSQPTLQQAVLTATVRDSQNNLVKNVPVRFSIANDNTGGRLISAAAITDSNGEATSTYQSSAATSAKDGIEIKAEIENKPSVPAAVVALTVARSALFVRMQTGNEIEEFQAVLYKYPYSVIVTDAAGNASVGTEVSLAVVPTRYFKGFWLFSGTGESGSWIPQSGSFFFPEEPFVCSSEDIGIDVGGVLVGADNGIIDANGVLTEDINGSGALEPGNVVSVPGTVVTDKTGTAVFDLTYPQGFGLWTEIRLSATARVAGTESSATETFFLTVLADDVNDPAIAPPGSRTGDIPVGDGTTFNSLIGPFGVVPDCTNKD